MLTLTQPEVRLFATARTWLAGEAVRQLHLVAKLDAVRHAVGFPNLASGKGSPVGAAFVAEEVIHPRLIGADIGCGLALCKTGLAASAAKPEEWSRLPFDLDRPWTGSIAAVRDRHGIESTPFDAELGTLGAGSHFAEVLTVENVDDPGVWLKTGIDRDQLLVLVHAGSGSVGESVLRTHLGQHFNPGTTGVDPESYAGSDYLRGHDLALGWARANRELVGQRLAATLGARSEVVCDAAHNEIVRGPSADDGWIHRHGVAAAGGPIVVIPGSCGGLTYVVRPLASDEAQAWSLPHGAGRKWALTETRVRMRERFDARQLMHTPGGGRVVCDERDRLYEDAPEAYKNIDAVVADLVEAGLVSVVATLRPVLTYKMRKSKR